jgi:hypothetical protein
MEKVLTRRALLRATGLSTAALVGLAATRAFAMSEQAMRGDSELGTAFANRCTVAGNDSAHTQIMAQLQATLMSQPGSKGQTLTQTAVCPICGCPITASRTIQ